jgi:acylphosphatase
LRYLGAEAPAQDTVMSDAPTAMPLVRLTATVRGRVQGVNFRQSAVREATRLGLTGWVMNRDDGAVDTVAEGLRSAVEAYAAWLAKGPRTAWVSRLETRWSDGSGEFTDFALRWY